MKLGVIGGAGLLGSTSAYLAGMKGYLDEIKLVDIKENLAKCHVMDMGQAFAAFSKQRSAMPNIRILAIATSF